YGPVLAMSGPINTYQTNLVNLGGAMTWAQVNAIKLMIWSTGNTIVDYVRLKVTVQPTCWTPTPTPTATQSGTPTATPTATIACNATLYNPGAETANGGGPYLDATAYNNWFY